MAHKIVVIEDEPDIANLLAFHLKSGGYDCFVARDGKKWAAAGPERTTGPRPS